MADKGEYRGIYVSLLDDPDFQELGAPARACLFVLRLKLGRAGIAPFARETLPRFTGHTADECEAGMQELSAADWIRVERNVVWLRNALRHDPAEPLRSPNQFKSIQAHLKSLPKLQIVKEFARYYELDKPFRKGSPNPSEAGSREEGDGLLDGLNVGAGVDVENQVPALDHDAILAATREAVRACNRGMSANKAIDKTRSHLIDEEQPASYQVMRDWLHEGIPLATVTEVAERAGQRYRPTGANPRIKSLGYLNNPVREAHQLAVLGEEAAKLPPLPDEPAGRDRRSRGHGRGRRSAPDQQTYVPTLEVPEF